MADDLDLVRKYARERDARAFAEIASRYGGLVYGVCLRVTGSAHDAEDLAQECFVKLAERAAAIDVPLARWLHTLARSRAVDAVRARAARRRHEEAAVGDRPDATEPTWDDVSAHLDDALAGLPDELRDPLVLHFLLGRAQTDVAAQLGVDQSTVSRRIERGVGELREKLRKAGVVVSAALLATLLTDNAASAAVPATLTAALGKMALAGVGKGAAVAAGASAAGGTVVALKAKLVVAAAVGLIAAGGVVTYRVVTRPGEADGTPAPTQVASTRPEGPARTDEAGAEDAMPDPSTEPDIKITPVPGESMTVRATGYGPGLAGTSHLRVGRGEVTNWYDSPSGELRETGEAVVTRTVRLLGRDCFEVRARSRKAGETEWSDPEFEYFFVDGAGTHWVKPKEGRAADLADDGAWETWDHLEGEGVSPVEVSTERPEVNATVKVVDLAIGGETVRCLRETFFEVEGGRVRYGGDVFRREDGTSILYYRLLAEGMKEYDALEGAREYELGDATLRVWETVLLVEESDPDEGAAGGRDYSKLALEGDHWRDDSFSLVMRAVARLFGREADHETVYALSANGFAPDVRPGDPCCKGTWRMFGRGRNMDVVAAYLGLAVRKLEFPKPPPLPAPDGQGRKWGTPAYNEWLDNRKKACAAIVREALGTGAVVIADGGWRNHEWFLWGVITEARPDGTIIGKTLSPPLKGDLDYCFMDHIRSYWTVTPADARLPQE
ncbi:MAG: RNA polymerase sigma factor, partial [Planctomycetota bacterium]